VCAARYSDSVQCESVKCCFPWQSLFVAGIHSESVAHVSSETAWYEVKSWELRKMEAEALTDKHPTDSSS
jgi:hypothetical protein